MVTDETTTEDKSEASVEVGPAVEEVSRENVESVEQNTNVDNSVLEILTDYSRETESAELARYVGLSKQDNPAELTSSLRGYFDDRRELFNAQDPQALAQEIVNLEQSFIANIEAQIDAQFPSLEGAKREQAIHSIREVLYSTILGGQLSFEKISNLISRGVVIKTIPGGEARSAATGYDKDKMLALCRGDSNGTSIYLYESFIAADAASQTHVLRHEIGHILTENGGIWSNDVLNAFYAAARNPTPETIGKFREYPELAEILKVLANPENQGLIWNHYIRERLDALGKIEPSTRPAEQVKVANELLAEMTAYFMEYRQSEASYLSRRLQFVSRDDLESYILKNTGVQSLEQLGLPANPSPQEIIRNLATRPELSTLFAANSAWYKKLNGSLMSGGKQVEAQNREFYDEDEFGDDDFEMEELEENVTPAEPEMIQNQGIAQPKTAKPPKSVFQTFWELFTGTPSP